MFLATTMKKATILVGVTNFLKNGAIWCNSYEKSCEFVREWEGA